MGPLAPLDPLLALIRSKRTQGISGSLRDGEFSPSDYFTIGQY